MYVKRALGLGRDVELEDIVKLEKIILSLDLSLNYNTSCTPRTVNYVKEKE